MKNSTKKAIWITTTLAVVFIFAICFFFIVKTDKDSPLSVKDETLSRISEIRNTLNTDIQDVVGNIYYLSNNGDDNADGRSPQTAWKTLSKLHSEFSKTIQSGDCILLNRGDVFRGNINITKDNILIGSYGDKEKPKPILNVSTYDGAVEGTWIQTQPNIWKYSEKISSDVGVIWFFKNNQSLSNKHDWGDYSYEIGQKISFDESFDENNMNMSEILDSDLEFYHTGKASSGINTGEYVYVYSEINPQLRFDKIEFSVGVNGIYGRTNLRVDNIKIVFAGNHGVGTGTVANLSVTNCEFGYIGGSRQNQNNVRFGNAIEIYGQVNETNGFEVEKGFIVENNYIYEVYDAGITFQYTANSSSTIIENAEFLNNVIEKCNYSIEYWNVSKSTTQDKQNSYIRSFKIKNNIFRYSGYGVSQTRPDKGQSAHIKTWVHDSEYENKVIGIFEIKNNLFYLSSEQMFAVYACDESSMPIVMDNVFLNDEKIPFGYYYNKELSKKIIPFVRSKMSKIFPNNTFYYTTNFYEQVLYGTSKDVMWNLDIKSGILEIYGVGEMEDYSLDNLPRWNNYSNFINEIIIGEDVTKLGTYSFYELQYVEKIEINGKNIQNLSNDKVNFNDGNNFTFYKTGRNWYGIKVEFGIDVERIPNFLFWPSSKSSEAPYIVQIEYKGNKLKEIGNHAFSGISCVDIEIPEGVEKLEVLSFSNSSTLKSIILPNSLTTLEGWSFAGNHYLEKVVIGENIHSLESNLFYGDVNLKQVIIKGNISETANISNIFSSDALEITLYGNDTVENFVQRYNQNNQNHQLKYSKIDNF